MRRGSASRRSIRGSRRSRARSAWARGGLSPHHAAAGAAQHHDRPHAHLCPLDQRVRRGHHPRLLPDDGAGEDLRDVPALRARRGGRRRGAAAGRVAGAVRPVARARRGAAPAREDDDGAASPSRTSRSASAPSAREPRFRARARRNPGHPRAERRRQIGETGDHRRLSPVRARAHADRRARRDRAAAGAAQYRLCGAEFRAVSASRPSRRTSRSPGAATAPCRHANPHCRAAAIRGAACVFRRGPSGGARRRPS